MILKYYIDNIIYITNIIILLYIKYIKYIKKYIKKNI